MTYLAIEADDAVHARESAFWLSRNISSIRVYSMSEGIEKAVNNQFLYIGINANNIDYKPILRILRDATYDPIFIAASNYSMQEQGEAHDLGADLFGQTGDTPEDNYKAVLRKINQLNARAKQRKDPIKILFHENILVVPSFRQVFLNDTHISLTKKEFDILCFIMENRGRVLSFNQIYRNVWGNEYDELTHNILRNHIKKLKCKFTAISPGYDVIENIHGVGYRIG